VGRGGEGRVADLDDRARHGTFGYLGGDLAGEAGDLRLDLVPVLDVLLEGDLAAVRSGDVRTRVDLGVAPAPAKQHQPGTGHRAELGRQPVRVGGGELADRVDAETFELVDRLLADAPDHVGRSVAEQLVPGLRGQPEHAGRLAEAGGDLRLQLVLADADRAVEAGRLLDAGGEVAGEGFGVRRLVGLVRLEADEGLIPAEHLHRGAGVPQHVHDHGRHLEVGGRVDRQENAVRAALLRGPQRQAGVDAEFARLVGGGRDHAPLGRVAVAADHDRLAAQLGVAQHLDGGDELIQINVQYPAGHPTSLTRPRPPQAITDRTGRATC
jgi:hypothetical protein